MRVTNVQTSGKNLRVAAAVTLRECSVVIVGSTCKICGRDFKCESDVALHTRWRHNAALESLMNVLDHKMSLGNISGQKCDVCGMSFEFISDLRTHKRLMHKQCRSGHRKRRREMVRVRFKLNGVTTTDVSLDRRYIKLQNSSLGYIVDVCTQTPDLFENEEKPERKDDPAGNIDLSFPNNAVDNSHMRCGIRPDKAANRYIVGKFASTEGDVTANRTVEKSLVKISNTLHKNAVPDNDSLCNNSHKDRCYLASQETTADVFIKTMADGMDIRDKKNSRRTNERARKNPYCQNEISFDDNEIFLIYQSGKSDKMSSMSKENPHYSIRWSDEVAGTKETAGLANSFTDSVKIIVNNEKSYGLDGDATKHSSPALSRLNRKPESMKTNSKVDDDVQEVLRITRGNAQCDINHESPNRIEREILVQNIISDTFTLPPQLQSTIYPEELDVAFMNFESSDYPSFMTVTESDYQILANSLNEKLGIYLEDLHHYGIYNDLPEINNNNLEERKF